MKKFFVFAAIVLTTCMASLKAENQQAVLDKINSLPMPFTTGTVVQSGHSVQAPYFWQFKVKEDIYHAAVVFEDYPDGIFSDSQCFLSLFMVWKNGQPHYRQVIENDSARINITDCEISQTSDGNIYLSLNYDFQTYPIKTFTSQKNNCTLVLPITGHLHAPVKEFESLLINNLPIKNGAARAPVSPRDKKQDEGEDIRYKNPVYQIIFPHCYVVQNEDHTFHLALVDRQHEDLLCFYIWKDRKLHSVYLLDHYTRYYSTPDRMKIKSAAGAEQFSRNPDGEIVITPVWKAVELFYVIEGQLSGPTIEHVPSTNYYKHNRVYIFLKNPGTYDMRKTQSKQGFIYTPHVEEK